MKKLITVLTIMGALSLTGLPAIAAAAVWSFIFALQNGG